MPTSHQARAVATASRPSLPDVGRKGIKGFLALAVVAVLLERAVPGK